MFYKLGRAGRALERFGAIDFATTIAPGVRDVLLTGKVYEAVRRRRDPGARAAASRRTTPSCSTRRRPAGSPGSSTSTTRSPGWPKVGPIRSQADSITALLQLAADRRAPGHAAGGDAGAGDRRRHRRAAQAGLPVGGVVVNLVREPLLPAPALAAAAGSGDPRGRGRGRPRGRRHARPATRWCGGLLTEARDHAERVSLERRQRADRARAGAPDLPSCRCLPDGIDLGALYELAELLADQGMA